MESSTVGSFDGRSEEHTSELQSRPHLVCRLLLEKKQKTTDNARTPSPPPRSFQRTPPTTPSPGEHHHSLSACQPSSTPRSPIESVFFFKKTAAPGIPPFSPTPPFSP